MTLSSSALITSEVFPFPRAGHVSRVLAARSGRKMLDQAKSLLVKEISLAKKAQEGIVEQEIQSIFAS